MLSLSNVAQLLPFPSDNPSAVRKDSETFCIKTVLQVCWYLTCERYWSQPEGRWTIFLLKFTTNMISWIIINFTTNMISILITRRMPNMLALALVLLSAAAVFASVTYYTVWVAFSHLPLPQPMKAPANSLVKNIQ